MTQILKSKGRYSVETHAWALCELNHVLPRALSRFLKNERDAETEPLFKGNLSLMKANARITGSQTAPLRPRSSAWAAAWPSAWPAGTACTSQRQGS